MSCTSPLEDDLPRPVHASTLSGMRRRRGFRGWAIAWAVLQFALPAAAAFGDARLERVSESSRGAHIESRSDDSCRPVHRAECALCQAVSRQSSPAPQTSGWQEIVSLIEQPVITEVAQRASLGRTRLASARAPPLS
jgi:hypothetical protein